MFFVYIIKSDNYKWYYVGMTSNIDKRLSEHNNGKCKSTKHYLPFKLVTFKEFDSRISAREYEKFLKVRSNKEKALLAY